MVASCWQSRSRNATCPFVRWSAGRTIISATLRAEGAFPCSVCLETRVVPLPRNCSRIRLMVRNDPVYRLRYHLLIQLGSRMTALVPSITQVRQIRIRQRMGPTPAFTGGRLFVLQGAIDTATSYPDAACNLFFALTDAKQFPDLLVQSDPFGMSASAVLFGLSGGRGLGRGRSRSSKLAGHRFEYLLMMPKEAPERFRKILLEMKAIGYLSSLGSATRCRLTEDFAAVTRDDVHFGMLLEPSSG